MCGGGACAMVEYRGIVSCTLEAGSCPLNCRSLPVARSKVFSLPARVMVQLPRLLSKRGHVRATRIIQPPKHSATHQSYLGAPESPHCLPLSTKLPW